MPHIWPKITWELWWVDVVQIHPKTMIIARPSNCRPSCCCPIVPLCLDDPGPGRRGGRCTSSRSRSPTPALPKSPWLCWINSIFYGYKWHIIQLINQFHPHSWIMIHNSLIWGIDPTLSCRRRRWRCPLASLCPRWSSSGPESQSRLPGIVNGRILSQIRIMNHLLAFFREDGKIWTMLEPNSSINKWQMAISHQPPEF